MRMGRAAGSAYPRTWGAIDRFPTPRCSKIGRDRPSGGKAACSGENTHAGTPRSSASSRSHSPYYSANRGYDFTVRSMDSFRLLERPRHNCSRTRACSTIRTNGGHSSVFETIFVGVYRRWLSRWRIGARADFTGRQSDAPRRIMMMHGKELPNAETARPALRQLIESAT